MKKIKVLFVPGYAGSTLIERKTKKLRWVRLSDFFSNKYDLSMTESYSDFPMKNDLIADQILMKVKLIPKILEIESYEKTPSHSRHTDLCLLVRRPLEHAQRAQQCVGP